jgi:hypothetical protein
MRTPPDVADGAGDDIERYLTDRVRRSPYSTLGAAAGLGYVLGGGLRSPLTVMLFGAAARIVAAQIVREMSGFGGSMSSRPGARVLPASVPIP